MPRAKYPHLLPLDCELWDRFLLANPERFPLIDYDVNVGQGRDPGPAYDPAIRKMGLDLSQRRIDAVGHTPDALYIIEITDTAGLKAIGQLIAYPTLYAETYAPRKPLLPLLVASRLQADIEPVLARNAIPWELYPSPD